MVNDDKRSTLRKRGAAATKTKPDATKTTPDETKTKPDASAVPGDTPGSIRLAGKTRKELPDIEYLLKYGEPGKPTPPSEKLFHLVLLIVLFLISLFLFHHFYFRHLLEDKRFNLPRARKPN